VEQGTTYSSVSAQWRVPSVTQESSSNVYADSTWVGIGGWSGPGLLQAGTTEESDDGTLFYFVWDELLPSQPIEQFRFAVNPSDLISATISLSRGSAWSISVVDKTTGQADNLTETYTGSTASAEFIQEAPSSAGNVLPMDPYQEFTFSNAEVNGAGARLNVSQQVWMPGLSVPSGPDPAGDAFNFEYGGATPLAPGSQDLLQHGSFESSAAGWNKIVPAGGVTNMALYHVGAGAPAAAHDGSWYLATNTNRPGGSVYQDVPVNATAGTAYVGTAWLSAQAGTATGTLCLWGLGSSNTNNCIPYSVTAGTYKLVQVVYDAPATINALRFQIYPTPNSNTTDLDTTSLR
jgi:hypothetical protein